MDNTISFRQSADGSMSAYNAKFDECYHSLKDGALNETLYKHIYPSLAHSVGCFGDALENLPNTSNTLCVLDICFGLGYNTLTLLSTLAKGQIPQQQIPNRQILKTPFKGKVKIYSPEIDENVFRTLRELAYPPFICETLPLEEILKHFESARQVSQYDGKIGDMEFEIYLYKGDTLVFLENLKRDLCGEFHIIFQDAFSPKKNPTLWSKEYFALLYHLLHPQGIITTYSQSRAVRENAINAGFRVYDYKANNVRGSSLISKESLNLEKLKEIK
ncbi:hypothetical protein HW260_04645 [Helicobacter cinaedi]|uniref:MnmC-like methyltransferase domain-containing protein n=1 Tax=Helicobacter cinaedi CCUG 18818 = ATCC BAA-847 TaxID=537971 RepID=A0AAI8MMI3_9HELI|nr:MnmC family methyltransferase [Helicobacter cinaedi]EFR46889.1 hypothetical protein HCCG_01436 [Helicobacter cinaedi CCUG 18818 = ATCC BAA-847]QOQ91596.1 hypothetical protein HW260_04645 [Helicobacter cinaedi]BAM32349.1 conserved hypothetical protein [Helicobacter cinaedi CCUG 18818 = ATCC BAA-847]